MRWIVPLLILALSQTPGNTDAGARAIFDTAQGWSAFLAGVKVQRERWAANAARATVPPALAARMTRAGAGLELLVVAQDLCLDSVNTVPYIARLADAAHVPLRVVDRATGEPLLNRYRSRDGRTVTPIVVLLRRSHVAGAWVERPAPLQRFFEQMIDDPEARRRFDARPEWYDTDASVTTMTEIVTLAERGAGGRPRLLPLDGEEKVLRQIAVAGPRGSERAGLPAERVADDAAADVARRLARAAARGGALERDLP